MFCGVNMDCYFHGCCQGEALKLVWHKLGEPGMCWGHCLLCTAAIRNCSAPPECSSSPKGLIPAAPAFLVMLLPTGEGEH